MKLYEYYLEYGTNSKIVNYINLNIDDLTKSEDTQYYYVIGAGGYFNSITYKPWDGEDMTPSKLVSESDITTLLTSMFHQLTFEDDGMSNLTEYEQTDFEKDIVPNNDKEVSRINSYIELELMSKLSKM